LRQNSFHIFPFSSRTVSEIGQYRESIIFFLVLLCCFHHLLFSADKWIVVTTIRYPTPQLRQLAEIPGWRLLVVGDKKTPSDWYLENCEYLSPQRQLNLGYQIAELLPWNHYSRKNIGYLFAIEHGAKVIYETDDDNEAMNGLSFCPPVGKLPALITPDHCINIYRYFGHPSIWPRGFPLDQILSSKEFQIAPPSACVIGIEQGVVNESPDLDAIFRLTQNTAIEFDPRPPCFLPKGLFCPFNSQNTFFHPIAFLTLYLPSSVSMRVSDVWRGYVAQRLIWEWGAALVFSGPNAVQKRNPHCLMNDFFLEQALYLSAGALVHFLGEWVYDGAGGPSQMMFSLFQDLIQHQFLEERELPLLSAWLMDLNQITKDSR
jgi:hypothetical protein